MLTLIIDGNNMAYRAKYAYSLSFRGKDTSVCYGVTRMLQSLIRAYKPDAVIATWDGGLPLYRRNLVSTYKMGRTRDLDYEEFLGQINDLHKILPLFGILSVKRRGIEADDLMYHASRMVHKSYIVSSDKDMLQAITADCSVIRPGARDDSIITIENFTQEVGVPFSKYTMYKLLVGDSSDNIPGVVGVGHQTAIRLLSQVKEASPENVIGVASGKTREKLYTYFNESYDNERTITRLDLDVVGATYTLLNTEYHEFSRRAYFNWCTSKGFASLIEYGATPVEFVQLKQPVFNYNGKKDPKVWDHYRGTRDEG